MDCNLVKHLVIITQTKFPTLLFDKQDWGQNGGGRQLLFTVAFTFLKMQVFHYFPIRLLFLALQGFLLQELTVIIAELSGRNFAVSPELSSAHSSFYALMA